MRLKIYADESHYTPDAKFHLTDIVRPFWVEKLGIDRGPGNTRIKDDFELVPSIAEADICVLPLFWQYYVNAHKVDQARQAAEDARRAGKRIIVYALGDYLPRVSLENAFWLGVSFRRSRRTAHQFAHPSLFNDYLEQYRNGQLAVRPKGPKPVIGFCGQGASRLHRLTLWTLRNLALQAHDRLVRQPYEPPPLIPHIFLRARVLALLSKSARVETKFLIRDKYMGGARGVDRKDPFSTMKLEYVDNIRDTDYTVCIRGTGNYSMRFYETLCLGRIPVFIDTDCVLPFDSTLDWKRYCVWVDQSEIPFVAEKVADFHAGLSQDDFVELQHACRKLWEEWLSAGGFYAHFREYLTPN
jgi:hypothetical protein